MGFFYFSPFYSWVNQGALCEEGRFDRCCYNFDKYQHVQRRDGYVELKIAEDR
jgi:hypothetical protein